MVENVSASQSLDRRFATPYDYNKCKMFVSNAFIEVYFALRGDEAVIKLKSLLTAHFVAIDRS